MSKTRIVHDTTRTSQSTASDPANSVWVSAHAGSGKTHVLSQRVIRLLLQETDPSRILCLTYTRAAAANMSKRVFADLAKWTELSDAALSERIADIEGAKPSRSDLLRARTLFATALETPGGLKVQTIHAFCESILHQFPLEANIAAHFQMLDTRMETALVAEARRDMISGAAGRDSPALTEAFATVLERGGEFGLDALLGEIVAKRDRLRRFIEAVGDGDYRFQLLFDEFGFGREETAENIANGAWPLPGFPVERFNDFVQIAQREDVKLVVKGILPDAIAGFQETDPVRRLALLAKGFRTGKDEPYGDKTFSKIARHMPDIVERYAEAVAALDEATDRLGLFRMVEGTRAALVVADRLIQRYENLKAARGFLDFNDLITRTHRLLSRQDAGAWVQYKLDQGIDHILIDEAQDTSPDQWAVVRALAAEFFVGEGARGNLNRTVFAVGDEKQSIYSFQGASPEAFGESGAAFAAAVRQTGKPFEKVELKQSFRSTRDVLYAVDRVFDNEVTRNGVASAPFTHDTTRVGDPGYVELWPYASAETVAEPEDWRQGIDHAKAPAVRVAEQVANTIQQWVRGQQVLEGTNTIIKPGDVMVLVRKRDRFVHALSRALKERLIDVAGADRLLLASHIAIKDLIALGRVLIQREDDLSLAAILKSPLFGLDEEQLFKLASDRPREVSLHQWIEKKAEAGDEVLRAVVEQLESWSSEAAFRPPFEFYSRVLGRDQRRHRFIGRLGHEAGEILDEFLTFCLAEETVGLSGLEELLTTLETAGPEIKREMDQGRNEVRILTVHASKGLEAPIVFLVDSGAEPAVDAHLPRLTPFPARSRDLRGVEGYLWRSSKDVSNRRLKDIVQGLRRLAEEEYRRLLYVGMTRAEERLILCGYYNVRKPPETTWLSLATAALAEGQGVLSVPHPSDPEQQVIRFSVTPPRKLEPPKRDKDPLALFPFVPPELTDRMPPQENLPRPLTPSGAALLIEGGYEAAPMRRSPVLEAEQVAASALDRGRVVHKLLQVLPDIAAPDRTEAMGRYLEHAARGWPVAERATVASAVEGLLADDGFAPVFAEGSAAEVPIAGTIEVRGRKRVVSGIIDRLAVTDSKVLIVDFKTNRPPPERLDDVPLSYILQLALYAELLRPIYPGRRVEAALLFTENAQLMNLPAEMLDAALARLTVA